MQKLHTSCETGAVTQFLGNLGSEGYRPPLQLCDEITQFPGPQAVSDGIGHCHDIAELAQEVSQSVNDRIVNCRNYALRA